MERRMRSPREAGRPSQRRSARSPLRGRGRLVLAGLLCDLGALGLALLPEFLAACLAPLGDRGVHHPETCLAARPPETSAAVPG